MSDPSNKSRFINAGRRGFLQGAAVTGGAAATGTATATSVKQTPEQALPEVNGHKGYELTDHIRKYYKRARF